MGLLAPMLSKAYGGSELDHLSYGLMMQEMERGDSGVRSAASVQGALVIYPLDAFGSEEQKRKYLPSLASGHKIGCFGLTEPDCGSDPGCMRTHFLEKDDHYLLNGSKLWITNAPHADLALVWAKNEKGRIQGLLWSAGLRAFLPRPSGANGLCVPVPQVS